MRKLRLRSIEWVEVDECRVIMEGSRGTTASALFTITRTDIGLGAQPEPNIFSNFDGTAAEVRALVGVVTQFCLVAQGEVPN